MFFLGLAIFFLPHIFSLARDQRDWLYNRLGDGAYKGLYSLVSLVGLGLIIYGYESSAPARPTFATWVNPSLMSLSFAVMIAGKLPSLTRHYLRHPLSLSIILWASAHLLVVREGQALILFVSFLVYAIVSPVIAEWQGRVSVPPKGQIKWDVLALILGVSLTMVITRLGHGGAAW